MEEILHQLRLVVYPNIYRVFYIFHQQYLKGLSFWVSAYFQGLMSMSFKQGILSKRREPLLTTSSKPAKSSTSQTVRGSVFSSNPVFSWSLINRISSQNSVVSKSIYPKMRLVSKPVVRPWKKTRLLVGGFNPFENY